MCRLAIPANSPDICLLCATTGQRKCNHELAVCSNQAVHRELSRYSTARWAHLCTPFRPANWKSYYYKNAGGIMTFQGCGFCKVCSSARWLRRVVTLLIECEKGRPRRACQDDSGESWMARMLLSAHGALLSLDSTPGLAYRCRLSSYGDTANGAVRARQHAEEIA